MKKALENSTPDLSIIGPTKTSQIKFTRNTFKRGICKQQ